MSKEYVTYLTYYRGSKLPPFYIGSSYKDKVVNGSVSSKKWKEIYLSEQLLNKALFKTRSEALSAELRLQKKHDVVKNTRYYNESFATVNGMFGRDVSGELNPMFGRD